MRPSRAEPSQSRSARQLPQRGSPWQIGSLPTGRLRPDMAQKSGPRLRGQRLLDDMICQAAVALGSRALQLIKQKAFLSQQKPCRHARGSPKGATATTAASGGNREELLGQRPAGCKRQRSRRWVPQPGLGAKRLRGSNGKVLYPRGQARFSFNRSSSAPASRSHSPLLRSRAWSPCGTGWSRTFRTWWAPGYPRS